MTHSVKFVRCSLLIAMLMFGGCSRKQPGVSEGEHDRKFQEMMTGVLLIGHSVPLEGQPLSGEEQFMIDKVSKLAWDTWLFRTRLKVHSQEIPVPIPLTVKWAGDTPVIMLTNLTIPGVGTYTARVLLYENQYAGTWSARTAGGQLFGKIVRQGQR